MNPLATIPNPFRSAIVADPWHWDMVDVPEIHQEAFDLCRQALELVRERHQSTSLLLHGAAGSGKTHLLARLQAWLAGMLTLYGPPPPAVFISVRMQTSPQMMWRHLRNRFGEDLLRQTANGRPQLERILLPRLARFSPGIGEPRAWMERVQRESRASQAAIGEVEDALDALDQAAQLNDRDLLVILGHFVLGRHRRDSRAWLRGESLPETALDQMGLKADQEGDPEERARNLVLSLCRMTGQEIPLVFCFDQVEALQSHPLDLAGLHRFGQMVSFLRDETQNTLLISCILSTFLNKLNEAVISSDRDRMTAFGERTLKPLLPNQAKRLIEARLNANPDLKKLLPGHRDRFWPLHESDIDQALAENRNTPRALLSYCAEKFEQTWRPGLMAPPPTTEEFLAQEMEERLDQAAASVGAEQADQILTHGLPLLLQLIDTHWERQATTPLKGADLVFESPRGRITICLCNHRNMNSLAAQLRRLREQMKDQVLEEQGRGKFLLLRDVRLPIGAHARKTRRHREELLAQGFQWIGASAEMIAALDALRGLLSDAKAGDLANGGESIAPSTVQGWLLANLSTRLRPLRDLLEAVLPDPSQIDTAVGGDPDFDLCEDISELLHLHHLVSVVDLACRLEREESAIEACARRHPERFGLLTGPPPVLFQLTLQAPETAAVSEETP